MNGYSRRTLVKTGLSLIGGGVASAAFPRISVAAGRIVVTDPGGATQQGFAAAFYEPFEKETGIKVTYAARPNLAMGQLKSMVLARNVEWDATYLVDYLVEVAVRDKLLDEFDYSGMDKALLAEMLPGTINPYSAGGTMYGTVMAYNTKKWPAGQGPQNWADFWDVKRFPGRRSMIGFGNGPIEQALLADGVPKDKLYPLDLRRAFAKLDEIRPHITVWTSASAQQHQLMVNEEVDLIHGFANRFQAAIDDRAPYVIQWQDGSLNLESWVLPRGAQHRDMVLKFVEFTLNAKRQAASVSKTGTGPSNGRAVQFIDPNRAKVLPTHPDNFSKMYRANAKWVSEHSDELQAKWTEWKARG